MTPSPVDGSPVIAGPPPLPAPAELPPGGPSGGADASVSTRSVDRALKRGIAWISAVKWSTQLLAWGSTVIVARILSPDDYGLVGMAGLFLGLIMLLSEFGIGAAVVNMRDLTRSQIAQINTLAVLFGGLGFLAGCAAAIPLGWFFHSPLLPPVVVAMSGVFAISAFRVVPYALLQRAHRFRAVALIDGGQAALLAIANVVFAWLGFRYWTLVLSSVLGAVLSVGFAIWAAPHPFARPRRAEVGRAVRFSGHVIGSRLAWFTFTDSDFLVAGKMLGKEALGVYTLAWTLANAPIEKVTGMIASVMPSIFSAVRTDKAALRRYLLMVSEAIALIGIPLSVGGALVAPLAVPIVLGDKWHAMIVPLQLLMSYAAFRSVSPLYSQVLQATGQARFEMQTSVLGALVLPMGFVLASRWGVVGIAAAWLVLHPAIVFRSYRQMARSIDLPHATYLRSLWPAVSSAAGMAAAVAAVGMLSRGRLPSWALLVAEVLTGALVYGALLVSLHGPRLRALRHDWRTTRG
ncbi:MAG TPA: lipopolysaccharide biosynthesis protein [Gemmatimonadaceae bacterium]|nr:lipopolysaccharide biosynthesis protein [Gemmatimonadaceae bacterium]